MDTLKNTQHLGNCNCKETSFIIAKLTFSVSSGLWSIIPGIWTLIFPTNNR